MCTSTLLGGRGSTGEGESVRVYKLAKTIADSFKYRNNLGMEVVLEAVKDAWNHRRVRIGELSGVSHGQCTPGS